MHTDQLKMLYRLVNELIYAKDEADDPLVRELLAAARRLRPDIDALLAQRLLALACGPRQAAQAKPRIATAP